jgi:redox-sensing transcriptional repressor
MTDPDNDPIFFISQPALRRLPGYYQYLRKQLNQGLDTISCTTIADELGLNPIQVRKDLQMTGAIGRPKIGYHVAATLEALEKCLGYNNTKDAFLVGVGNLGMALLGYEGFKAYGLNIVAAFDTDPAKIGFECRGRIIQPLAKFSNLAQRMNIQIGIITVPPQEAVQTSILMVNAGIKAIWNFAPVHLNLPAGIIVQNENMAASLAVLSNALMKFSAKGEPKWKE